MPGDYHEMSDQFWHQGWTTLPPISPDLALSLQRRALSWADDLSHHRVGTSSGGGPSRYDVIDGLDVLEKFGELVGLYHGLRSTVEHAIGQTLVLSPWPRSFINIKLYRGVGAGQGWHRDSNPVTVLLYLADHGTHLEFRDNTGKKTRVKPETGKVIVMRGKEFEHRVPPSRVGGARISVPMNFYYPDDCERPPWLDGVIYENNPVPGA